MLCRQLPATPESAANARQLAHQFLLDHVGNGDVVEEMLLATSELVTNAIKFGRGREPVWLHVLVTPERIAITVTDAGLAPTCPERTS